MALPTRSRFLFAVAALCTVVALLAALQVVYGLLWVENLRLGQRQELLAEISRGHGELVQNLRTLYESGRQHARSLSRTPVVRAFGRSAATESVPPPETSELDAVCLPYLLSFEHLDGLTLLDASGAELYRCGRMGGGAGSIPEARLGRFDPRLFTALRAGLSRSDVAVSPLRREEDRVEVRAEDREVIHYLTPVAGVATPEVEVDGEVFLLLTVYASRLLAPVRTYRPVVGMASALADAGGVHWFEPTSSGGALGDAWRDDAARRAIAAGNAAPFETDTGVAWAGRIDLEPAVHLVTVVGEAELADRVSPWRRGGVTIIAAMVGSVALVGIAFVAILGLSRRAWRQSESERLIAFSRAEVRRLRILIENSADLILVIDPATGAVREANRSARELLGLSADDAPPRRLDELLDRDQYRSLYAALEQASGQAGAPVSSSSFELAAPDGSRRTVDVRCVAVEFDEEPLVLIAFRDRTREREVEKQLLIGDRLSSLGLLTAGVAHEINNPLEGIGNYLALLRKEGLPEAKRVQYLEQVQHGFTRIRDLVRDLLALGRGRPRVGAADLVTVLARSERLARMSGTFREVDFAIDAPPPGLSISADSGQLEQVLLNLFLNAANAMNGEGSLRVRIRSSSGTAGRGEETVVIEVDDTGPGFDEATIDRVFDPFFTTGDGSGLGLAIAFGIVEAHGGTITAANRPEGGARVTLTLPRIGGSGSEKSSKGEDS